MPRNCNSHNDLPLYMTSRFSNFPGFLSVNSSNSSSDHSKMYGIAGCIILVGVVVYIIAILTPVGRGCMGTLSAKISEATKPSQVVEAASDADLEDQLQKSSKCFVMFYAPWCGHCKTTKPIFAEAASKDSSTKYMLANCQDKISKDTMSKHGVDAFPKMVLYKDGKQSKEFREQRSVENMIKFCKD